MSLIAWYPLDGNLEDYSGNLENMSGSWTIDNNGKIGKCYKKNGTMNLPLSPIDIGDRMTLSFWIYVPSTSSGSTIFKNSSDTYRTIINCFQYPTKNDFHWSTSKADGSSGFIGYVDSGVLLDDTWTHVCVTYEDLNLKIYYNGELKRDSILSTKPKTDVSDNIVMACGTDVKMNDIRIYDEVLSVKEIKEIAKAKILHYNFNQFAESTENIIPNPHIFSSGWTSYTNGNDGAFITEFGTEGLNITNKRSWCGAYKGITLPSTGTYTLSVWVKVISRTNTSINATLYTSGGGIGDAFVSASWDSDKIGQWQKIEMTRTYSTTSINFYLICFGASDAEGYEISVQYTMPQIELKSHSTEFTSGTRIDKVTDNSGFRNHSQELSTSTSPQWTTDSIMGGGCYKFDKTKTIITANTPIFSSNIYSVSLWFNKSDTEYYQGIFQMLNPRTMRLMGFEDSKMRWHPLGLTNGNPFIEFSYEINKWYHVVMVLNGTSAKLYVNGNKVGEKTLDVSLDSLNPSNIILGRDEGDNQRIFNGYIDDVRIYATALSDEDIKTLYQSRGSVTKNGKVMINEVYERVNYAYEINNQLEKKQFGNGLSSYEQTHCKVTLTDDGIRIFRTPNLIYSSAGNVMWGGLKLQFPEGTFFKGRKYKLSFKAKGKTSFGIGKPYLTPQMGWTAGGLTQLDCMSAVVIPSNFNSDSYKEFYAIFDLSNFNVYQTATKTQSIFVEGNVYNCCRDLALGFGYADTGELGTDIYIRDIELIDITDSDNSHINKKSQLVTNEIVEFNYKPSLIDYSGWTVGDTVPSGWSNNGSSTENCRLVHTNPRGDLDIMWATLNNDADSNSDGGFHSPNANIDKTKKYRFSVWIKRENIGDGRTYFGLNSYDSSGAENGLLKLDGTAIANPYFTNFVKSDSFGSACNDDWILIIGYVHPEGYSGSNDSTNGAYTKDGTRIGGLTDYKWSSTASTARIRSYLYYSTKTDERQYFYRPRIDVCDGSEPSIKELLSCIEHMPLVEATGLLRPKNIFSIGKNGKIYSREFIED